MTTSRWTTALTINGRTYTCDTSSSTDREFYVKQAAYLAAAYPQAGVTYSVFDIGRSYVKVAPKNLRPWC
jgi:hypothetical protein